MPESAAPDPQRELDQLLDRLSRAADGVEARLAEPRIARPDGAAGAELEERLRAVSAENRRLRETLAEAGKKARRLRNRLAHVEDEV